MDKSKRTSDNNKDKDCFCLPCRLITGVGVIGIGAYIFAQSKKRTRIEAGIMKILSAGAVFVGVARLLNADFLKANKHVK